MSTNSNVSDHRSFRTPQEFWESLGAEFPEEGSIESLTGVEKIFVTVTTLIEAIHTMSEHELSFDRRFYHPHRGGWFNKFFEDLASELDFRKSWLEGNSYVRYDGEEKTGYGGNVVIRTYECQLEHGGEFMQLKYYPGTMCGQIDGQVIVTYKGERYNVQSGSCRVAKMAIY